MTDYVIQAKDSLIEAAGRTTQGFGLGRIVGQLYALLYFNPGPMSLDEMAEELQVSKGSVSTNIRELSKWSAVHKVWVKGSRRDFYEAEVDLGRIMREGVLPFFQNKVNSAQIEFNEVRALLDSASHLKNSDQAKINFIRERLVRFQEARTQIANLLSMFNI